MIKLSNSLGGQPRNSGINSQNKKRIQTLVHGFLYKSDTRNDIITNQIHKSSSCKLDGGEKRIPTPYSDTNKIRCNQQKQQQQDKTNQINDSTDSDLFFLLLELSCLSVLLLHFFCVNWKFSLHISCARAENRFSFSFNCVVYHYFHVLYLHEHKIWSKH